ncbi:MAG: DUF3488 and transglutaminase-like domain-containing protein [Desulfovermiculus sp.]|nr:DUF3488 and transglutaminase-like domain-containing protein [Desulfovermiculus sp.]
MDKRLSAQHMIPLVMALAYAPHVGHMPIWVSMFFVLLWALHLLSRDQRAEARGQKSEVRGLQKQRVIIPNTIANKRKATFGSNLQEGFISTRFIGFLRLPLAVFSLASVLLYWGGKLGPLPGTALLSLMLGIKALEISGYRDQVITLYTALFLLFVTVLFHQSLLMGVYILLASWVLLSALCALNSQQTRPALGTSGRILAQALPLALIFFLLFPRLPGSLFGLTQNPTTGRTGLSSTLSPGSISQLILSNAPAFRAQFQGQPPQRDKLYWRAAVLRKYDGQKWTPGHANIPWDHKELLPSADNDQDGYAVHIALEPHNSRMLPALDIPVFASEKTAIVPGQVLRAKKKITQAFAYELKSVPDFDWPSLSQAELRACLAINSQDNPRTQKALNAILPDQATARDKLQAIVQFFQDHDFTYTLSPPLLPQADPIDTFLLETRAGYCEHYAQAFVWMARAVGLPARIVVGYQGGEYNPLAEFILVRESDAHAWAEVWLPSRGWTRVDPTSFVAPARIELGARQIHPELYASPLWDTKGLNWMYSAWTQVNMAWDALNYSWGEWVIGYSNQKQTSLFSDLGLTTDIRDFLPQLILIALGIFLAFMLFLAVVLYISSHETQDPTQILYLRFQKKLQKAGIQPLAHEGPLDLAHRAGKIRPDLEAKMQQIISFYIAQRFGPTPSNQGLRQLRKKVQRFRPGKG